MTEKLTDEEVEDAFWKGVEIGYKKKYGVELERLTPQDADQVYRIKNPKDIEEICDIADDLMRRMKNTELLGDENRGKS